MDTLRNYTFLPWMRQGVGADITRVDPLGTVGGPAAPERSDVTVSFTVNGQAVSKPVQVLGPGDVVGINPRAVVKTDPRNFVTDFEPNYLAYIEFYEEDFPWRFTPARAAGSLAQSCLRPWIFLVVLREDEFDEKKSAGPLAAFEIRQGVDPGGVFPDPAQAWAWAHVHVSRNVIGAFLQAATEAAARQVEQNLAQALAVNRDVASSRLLCPRKLEANAAYHAFVIPAFETGRLAGLGLEIPSGTDGQTASWSAGQTLYPIYYRWFFRTGAKGDFEFLVDLLEPRPVDRRVGIRDMDLQEPGYEVAGMARPFDVMGLEGALRSPDTQSSPPQWPPANTDFDNPPPRSPGAFLNALEAKVNLQFTLQQEETAANPHPDPIIAPPLYGQWYAMAEKLDARAGTGWVDELNRDPRYRTPAGAGTQVIQKEQERFMQQAWSQLGDLLQANQKIRQVQLAWMSSFQAYRKNVVVQPTEQLMAFTQPVQARVLASSTTIARRVVESRLPRAAIDPAFRKIVRPRGAIMRKVPDPRASARPVLAELNAGKLSAAPPTPPPTGQISLDALADAMAPALIPERLREPLRQGRIGRGLTVLLVLSIPLTFVSHALLFGTLSVLLAAARAAAARGRKLLLAAAAAGYRDSTFVPAAVDGIPPRPDFVLTDYEAPLPRPTGGERDSAEAESLRVALKDAFNVYQSPPPPRPVREPLALEALAVTLRASLNPAVTIPRRAQFALDIPAAIRDAYLKPHQTIVPVMTHPVFAEPMYRPLRDMSAELMAPNLELIPNNTISLMVTNQRFIEAYMVGLNHEMGRELLWRQFPTDQRGSYFRQFWDVADTVNRDPSKTAAQLEEELLDVTKLHTWNRDSALGTHASRPLPDGAEPGDARLVLVIRGDVLKKYPTAVVYAQRAKWTKDAQGRDIRELDETDPDQNIKVPAFKAEIDPDVRFLGFDLTEPIAKGSADPADDDPGWFFVIQERPGEPRFGLDNFSEESPESAGRWDELAWEHLGNFATLGTVDLNAPISASITTAPDNQFAWGRNGADMAYILYQVPVMVAFHADDMLT